MNPADRLQKAIDASGIKTREDLVAAWRAYAEKYLLGRQIVEVRYMTEQEQQEQRKMGVADRVWPCAALVLVLNDGTKAWMSADDEGNGPGALFGQTADGEKFKCPVT